MPWKTILLIGVIACNGEKAAVESACNDLCNELQGTCGYDAYPDYGSCLEGCAYYQEEGVDIEGQLGCIQEAQCDTFAVLECENQYGIENSE